MTKPTGNPRKALGRGLNSLLPTRRTPPAPETAAPPPAWPTTRLPIDLIDPNPVQPRTAFPAERLAELAASVRAHGVIQPLLVRPRGDRYQLVAGERRWRAAKLAGLAEVPVVVQEVPDERLLEMTLVENIQREDLNPLEVARAFERLIRELGFTQEQIAERTGKDRSTVSNLLRLLKLPGDVQQLLAEHRLSMGHARAILGLPDEDLQRQVAEKASSQGLSVRQVERLVQRMTRPREPKPLSEVLDDPNVQAAVQEMERVLGTRVRIVSKGDQRGRIEIEYYSAEDLDRVYSIITGNRP